MGFLMKPARTGREVALRRVALTVAVALLWAPSPGRADVTGQAGELYSIEKREVMGSHELMVSFGTLPTDAFGKGMTLQGSYAYHFSQLIGWEIIGGTWSFNFGTGLKEELKDRFDVQPTEVGELKWILHSNFLFKPLFGKFSLANDKLFNGEMFFVLGYALGGYTAALPSGLDVGVALRMFLGKYFSLRLDIRDYMFLPDFASMENNFYISLGLSLTFGFGDEEDEK
jgi:outer membrane beta-barrel protein